VVSLHKKKKMSNNAWKRTVSLFYIRFKCDAPCRKRIPCTITCTITRATVVYLNNSLHYARYARIFVRGHYLFREANSFPRAAKLRLLCLLSIGFKNWGISSDIPQFQLGNIRPRDAFRPIARERKYLLDYNSR